MITRYPTMAQVHTVIKQTADDLGPLYFTSVETSVRTIAFSTHSKMTYCTQRVGMGRWDTSRAEYRMYLSGAVWARMVQAFGLKAARKWSFVLYNIIGIDEDAKPTFFSPGSILYVTFGGLQ